MKKYGAAIIVSLAMFILVLDTTMMNVSLTALTQDLNTEIDRIQLAIALYALVMAAFMLTGGKLGRIFGTRRVFVIGTALYGAGTLTAALSRNVGMLIAGWSVIEGVGAAFMVPTMVSFLMTAYQGKERMAAFATLAAVSVAGAAVGPVVGGAFTTYASWRWAFGMEAVIVAVVLAFSHTLRGQRSPVRLRMDWPGVALSAAGMGCLVVGIISTTRYGWWHAARPLVLGGLEITPFGLSVSPVLMIGGGVILLSFLLWQRRQERKGREPLLHVRLISNRCYMAGVGVNLAVQLCLAAMLFTMPFFLQTILHKTAIETGILLMPITMVMLVVTFLTARLAARIPIRYLVMAGIVACAVGTVLAALSFSVHMKATDLIPGLVVFGVGLGLALSQLQNAALSSTEQSETDEGSGLFNSAKNLGSSIGTAIAGTLLLTFFLGGLATGINGSAVLPQQDKDQLTALVTDSTRRMDSKDLLADIKATIADYPEDCVEEIRSVMGNAIGRSMRITYYALTGILLASLGAAALLPRRKMETSPTESTGPP